MKVIVSDGMEKSEEIEIEIPQISVKDLLARLEINPFEAVVSKNGEIVRESEILTMADKVKIISVIHGVE